MPLPPASESCSSPCSEPDSPVTSYSWPEFNPQSPGSHNLSNYWPWDEDQAFLETYRAIEAHTLVDRYRCYELWTLVQQAVKLEGGLIEVGVWRGGTGALIARRAQLSGVQA